MVRDGVLYLKPADSDAIHAVDPVKRALKWKRPMKPAMNAIWP